MKLGLTRQKSTPQPSGAHGPITSGSRRRSPNPSTYRSCAQRLDVTVRRFPSIAVRLRRGAFWYYLEQIPKAPDIQEEKSCPLQHVPFDSVRKCAFRVLVYKNRMAVEFFHAVTDGTGGLIFLKTLLAEYLSEKYGLNVPAEHGVLGRLEEPDEEELEDSFLRYAGDVKASRKRRPLGT